MSIGGLFYCIFRPESHNTRACVSGSTNVKASLKVLQNLRAHSRIESGCIMLLRFRHRYLPILNSRDRESEYSRTTSFASSSSFSTSISKLSSSISSSSTPSESSISSKSSSSALEISPVRRRDRERRRLTGQRWWAVEREREWEEV